ncbi:type I-F CRISPR-associated helicase Cas3 [Aliidiomarina taiwanensis]|uniref:Type I-F CRISPR-associated helicase Cas3 n=1 Tax=Aliidiomarina taiwanensis TaxID=946228 RepID=A0A432X7E0_9GAMM|nr:type I-F CRISPR-associated helicase Cas3f [Aliidiomarina taiwanensis]RUO42765.1 type I-F CRISPR-associated helicase Cas3 [Aliidiomarina taiwanensis]
MMVTFVSQCEKKALNRTRRVLDAFANRIGDNTWQTVITNEGLHAVKKLLRKTASKSTAVSCHWIRSRSRSDLLWMVGNRRKFNEQGIVPVNFTKRNILKNHWENSWQYASSIQIMATLGALMHDLGKATVGFQNKLLSRSKVGDPYRHEWISLKIFTWLVKGCENDQQWLDRLSEIDDYLDKNRFSDDILEQAEKEHAEISHLPPLAQWLAWLIVSHHRLPPLDSVFIENKAKLRVKQGDKKLKRSQKKFYEKLKAHVYWVKNKAAIEENTEATNNKFWKLASPIMDSPKWRSGVKRWSKKALADNTLMTLADEQDTIANPILLHLSRLSLMLGDHNYSSLDSAKKDHEKRRVKGAEGFKDLAANTDRKTGVIKQPLDEHLIGVAKFTAEFARKLPIVANVLPRLEKHQPLEKHTSIQRFKWQNKAFDVARKYQQASDENGFFGVNMASTGCGKTIGNARIMYALSNPDKGARFTIALGLRILTLQTGQSFRKDLKLDEDQLAVLVGGASKDLFHLQEEQDRQNDSKLFGSESAESLLHEWVDSDANIDILHELGLGTVVESKSAQALLATPIVSCTVDHIIQASESKRGGKYIAPMLRLLSGDLILDEPDDFNHEDLPALARLVHLAGLFGAKVLLSSATLPPDLVSGLFEAYKTGRTLFNQSQNKPAPQVVCAWFDENKSQAVQTFATEKFNEQQQIFSDKRAQFLNKQPAQRKAKILPLKLTYSYEDEQSFYLELSANLLEEAFSLHQQYHLQHEDKSVSIGLIRIANIKNIIEIAQAVYSGVAINQGVHVHLCCYHASQVLLLRNSLEQKLDTVLKRDEEAPEALFAHAEINQALKRSSAKHHIFIVLATPVAEVGRDHDYDWAIVEPSSMRSIIQLAGRVWRHRPHKVADKANISVMQYNIASMKSNHQIGRPVFTRPGFETEHHLLATHDMHELMPEALREKINASARIIKANPLQPEKQLADLEQQVMQTTMNNENLNFVNAYWQRPNNSHRSHTYLQTLSPFRAGSLQETWLVIPESESAFDFYSHEQVMKERLSKASLHNKNFTISSIDQKSSQVSPWLTNSLFEELEKLQNQQPDKSLNYLAIKYATVSLRESSRGWRFNESLGFWPRK